MSDDNTKDDTARRAELAALITGFRRSMGAGKTMPDAEWNAIWTKVKTLAGATGKSGMDEVKYALVYIAITYGTSPEVDWDPVKFVTASKTLPFRDIVAVIDRSRFRRFMSRFSAEAREVYEASSDIRSLLQERAIRNGLPLTEAYNAIDFLSTENQPPAVVARSLRAKNAAIRRTIHNRVSRQEMDAVEVARQAVSDDIEEL
jgi:hypothetical protein